MTTPRYEAEFVHRVTVDIAEQPTELSKMEWQMFHDFDEAKQWIADQWRDAEFPEWAQINEYGDDPFLDDGEPPIAVYFVHREDPVAVKNITVNIDSETME